MRPWIGRDGNDGAYATDGRPYITLASGGLKPEGSQIPSLWSTAKGAWDSYNRALAEMAEQYPGCTIEWRVQPNLETAWEHSDGWPSIQRHWVRSRLAFVKVAA